MAIGAGIMGAGGQEDMGRGRSKGFDAEAVNLGPDKEFPSGASSMEVPGDGMVHPDPSQKQLRHYDQCACNAADLIEDWVKPS